MVLKSIFNKKMNKKGNVVLDSFFFFIAVVVFIVIAITGSYILNNFNTEYQADPSADNQSKQIIADLNTDLPTWFDYGAAAVVILLWALVLVASFYIDSHPIFFMISVIVLMIAIFGVNQFIDAIDDYLAEPDIQLVAQSFPISTFLIANIEKFVALVGFSIAIVMYAKFKQ